MGAARMQSVPVTLPIIIERQDAKIKEKRAKYLGSKIDIKIFSISLRVPDRAKEGSIIPTPKSMPTTSFTTIMPFNEIDNRFITLFFKNSRYTNNIK